MAHPDRVRRNYPNGAPVVLVDKPAGVSIRYVRQYDVKADQAIRDLDVHALKTWPLLAYLQKHAGSAWPDPLVDGTYVLSHKGVLWTLVVSAGGVTHITSDVEDRPQ